MKRREKGRRGGRGEGGRIVFVGIVGQRMGGHKFCLKCGFKF